MDEFASHEEIAIELSLREVKTHPYRTFVTAAVSRVWGNLGLLTTNLKSINLSHFDDNASQHAFFLRHELSYSYCRISVSVNYDIFELIVGSHLSSAGPTVRQASSHLSGRSYGPTCRLSPKQWPVLRSDNSAPT